MIEHNLVSSKLGPGVPTRPRSRDPKLFVSKATLWALVLAFVMSWGALGWAQGDPQAEHVKGGDYLLSHDGWNGMSMLPTLAERLGMTIVDEEELDYGKLDVDEPLIIVFPLDELDVRNLTRFVIAGGRVILADDYGKSEAFLKRLDLDRVRPVEGTLPHRTFAQGNSGFPRFSPRGKHPLLVDVEEIIANHPSILFNVGGPVIAYEEGGGLVYDMNLGKGKVIVIADPSLLINHMLQVADNAKLLRNALRYACLDPSPAPLDLGAGEEKAEAKEKGGEEEANEQRCKLHLYAKAIPQRGHFAGEDEKLTALDREVIEDLEAINTGIQQFMEGLPAAELFFYMGLLLALGLAVYLYTIFPIRRSRPYSSYIEDIHRGVQAPQSEFDWNLARFAAGSAGMNYALPVSILKEIFEELFLKALDLWPAEPGARPDVEELGRIFAIEYLGDAAFDAERKIEAQVVEVLAEFATVPTRHRVFLEGDSYYSERDLLKLYTRSIEILEIMGLKEEYERRTRSHVI